MPKRKAVDTIEPTTPVKKTATTAITKSSHKKPTITVTTDRTKKLVATRYTPQQERSITEFSGITQADKSTAGKILKQAGWNVSQAVNAFFNSSHTAQNPARTKVNQIFDKYREDPKELADEINFDGVGQLLEDLGIDVEDIGALVLFEIAQSPQLGKITRDGFVSGFSDAGADSTTKMRNIILARKSKLPTDRSIFKSVYNHTFTLLIEDRKKAIDLDQAATFWRLLFAPDGFEWSSANTPWLDWWLEFLTTKWNKAVNKDLWRQTLAFAEASRKDETLGFWNEESSWPSVIDDFVGWVKSEKNVDAMDVE